MIEKIFNKHSSEPMFYVNSARDISFFKGNDLNYMRAFNNSTEIYLEDGRMITVFTPFCTCCDILKEYITCINDSFAYNYMQLSSYHKTNKTLLFRNNVLYQMTDEQATAFNKKEARLGTKL